MRKKLIIMLFTCALLLSWVKFSISTEPFYDDIEIVRPCTKCEMIQFNQFFQMSTAIFVNVSLTLLKMDFINLNKMEAEITVLLNLEWQDSRVENNDKTQTDAVNNKIWEPVITLIDGRLTNSDESHTTQHWRGSNHHVQHNSKKTLIVQCSRYFKHYPFDTQECLVKWGSYRFSIDEVLLIWTKIPIQVQTMLQLHDFDLINIQTYSEVDIRPSGNFSVLVVKITVKRRYERIILCKFLPVLLLLIMSYITFWLSFSFVSRFRFYASIYPLIGEIFLYSTVSCSVYSPKLTALDVWYLGCMILSLYTFIHTILITYLKDLTSMDDFKSIPYPSAPQISSGIEFERRNIEYLKPLVLKTPLATWFDNIMRLLFPTLSFTLFVIYCALYITYKAF